jgi:putative ABC transport system permease protein
MLLLVGAGLLIQTLLNLRGQYVGMEPANVLTLRTELPTTKYPDLPRRTAFYDEVLARVSAVPGVVSAGYTTSAPLVWKGGGTSFFPEGRQPDPAVPYSANFRQISADYFDAIGVQVLDGRSFANTDDAQSQRVAIINQTMARQYWPGDEPVGKRFNLGGPNSTTPWIIIVGIVADVRQMGVDVPVKAEMYFPYRQVANLGVFRPRDLVVRTSVEPTSVINAIRSEIHAVDSSQPISDVRTMAGILGQETAHRRMGMLLLVSLAALALLLSMLGIFGVLSYFVAEQTQDIKNIIGEVVRKGMVPTVIGLGVGSGGALGLARLMESLVYEVSPTDPLTFSGVAALLFTAALLACYLPARRAMKVDPIVALREE